MRLGPADPLRGDEGDTGGLLDGVDEEGAILSGSSTKGGPPAADEEDEEAFAGVILGDEG